MNTDLTASLSAGSKIDLLNAESPFKLWAYDVSIQTISSTEITVLTADVDNELGSVEVAANDYVCPAGKANIPMIPIEWMPVLSELICYRAMKALGAAKNVAEIKANIADMIDQAMSITSNRMEDEVDVMYDADGLLNSLGGDFQGIGLGVRSR